jgi:hypothetical protein
MEEGMPFTKRTNRWHQRTEAILLGRACAGFGRVSVTATGDLGVHPEALASLWSRVDEVVAHSDNDKELLARNLAVPESLLKIDGRGYSGAGPWSLPEGRGAITVFGPPEGEWHEQLLRDGRFIVHKVARKVLGRHTDPVRARVVGAYRALKS